MPVNAAEWDLHKANWSHWDNNWRYACVGAELDFPIDLHQIFDPPVPQEDVQRWLNHHNTNPRAAAQGQGVRIGRVPPKLELLNKADTTYTWLAFSEILDNILDNYRRYSSGKIGIGQQPRSLQVSIDVMQPNSIEDIFIYIDENSGGIPQESLDSFVSLGVSAWNSDQDTVGCWGNGQKIAMARLGRYNQVTTNNGTDNPFILKLGSHLPPDEDGGEGSAATEQPKNYYHRDNTCWTLEKFPLDDDSPDVADGKTISCFKKVPEITFNDLTIEESWQEIVSKLTQIFANKFNEIPKLLQKEMRTNGVDGDAPEISITLGHDVHGTTQIVNSLVGGIYGENDELIGDFDELEKTFSIFPGIKPRRIRITIPAEQIGTGPSDDAQNDAQIGDTNLGYVPQNIEIEMLVGMRHTQPENEGITFWGNGKLFEKSWDNFMPLQGLVSGRNKNDDQQRFWKCYVRLWSQNPMLIPWGLGTKWTYRDESPAKLILSVIYHAVCYPYWKASMEGQWIGGQSRLVRNLTSGLWGEDLPETEEKILCPSTEEDFESILEWMYEMDDDIVTSFLSDYIGEEDRVQIITQTPDATDANPEPVAGPVLIEGASSTRNTIFRNKVGMRTLECDVKYRFGELFRTAPNIPSGQNTGVNARRNDLCAKYMLIRTWPEAFLSTEAEDGIDLDINSFNEMFDEWVDSQNQEADDGGNADGGGDGGNAGDGGDGGNAGDGGNDGDEDDTEPRKCDHCGQIILE